MIKVRIILFLALLQGCSNLIEKNEIVSQSFEIYYPPQEVVEDGEWIKIDTVLFVHSKYSSTEFDNEEDAGLRPEADHLLKSTEYIVFKRFKKDISSKASSNEIAMGLARAILSIKDVEGNSFYKIDLGSKLLFEGKVSIQRTDGKPLTIIKSNNYSAVVKKIP